jgi:hypothetical protein
LDAEKFQERGFFEILSNYQCDFRLFEPTTEPHGSP